MLFKLVCNILYIRTRCKGPHLPHSSFPIVLQQPRIPVQFKSQIYQVMSQTYQEASQGGKFEVHGIYHPIYIYVQYKKFAQSGYRAINIKICY